MTDFEYELDCPHCGASFSLPQMEGGQQATCPVCRGAVILIAEDAAPSDGRVAAGATRSATSFDIGGPAFVCIDQEVRVNPLVAGPLIAAFTGQAERDAKTRVARGMGILADHLAVDTARNLVAALAEEGIGAFAVPAAVVPKLEPYGRARRVDRVHAEGIELAMASGGEQRVVRWQDIAAGVCTRSRMRRRVEAESDARIVAGSVGVYGAVPAVRRISRTRVKEMPSELSLSLVLRAGEGCGHVLRFSERQVRYAYLRDRVLPASAQNLGLFLGDVMDGATGAFFPVSMRQVAAGHRERARMILGKKDLGDYEKWAACCAAIRGLFGPRD
jgi:hypothetical protein